MKPPPSRSSSGPRAWRKLFRHLRNLRRPRSLERALPRQRTQWPSRSGLHRQQDQGAHPRRRADNLEVSLKLLNTDHSIPGSCTMSAFRRMWTRSSAKAEHRSLYASARSENGSPPRSHRTLPPRGPHRMHQPLSLRHCADGVNAADKYYYPFEPELLPLAVGKQMGIIAMKVMARGRISPVGRRPPLRRRNIRGKAPEPSPPRPAPSQNERHSSTISRFPSAPLLSAAITCSRSRSVCSWPANSPLSAKTKWQNSKQNRTHSKTSALFPTDEALKLHLANRSSQPLFSYADLSYPDLSYPELSCPLFS